MYKYFYLPSFFINYLVIIFLFSFFITDLFPVDFFVLILIITPFIIRKPKRMELKDSSEGLKSPINGRCKLIKQDGTRTIVEFKIHFFNDYGVRFPADARVVESTQRRVVLEDDSSNIIEFHFAPNISRFFNFWAKEGDKGKRGALLAVMPFGGIVKLGINCKDEKLIVKDNEKVFVGQAIAALR